MSESKASGNSFWKTASLYLSLCLGSSLFLLLSLPVYPFTFSLIFSCLLLTLSACMSSFSCYSVSLPLSPLFSLTVFLILFLFHAKFSFLILPLLHPYINSHIAEKKNTHSIHNTDLTCIYDPVFGGCVWRFSLGDLNISFQGPRQSWASKRKATRLRLTLLSTSLRAMNWRV